jgi:hypothetical protein
MSLNPRGAAPAWIGVVNVKRAQRLLRALARKMGEGWGEGNGQSAFHFQGWQLAMPVGSKKEKA